MRAEGEIRFPKDWNHTPHPGCGLEKAREQLIPWVREMRGGVLTGAYEIERNLGGFVEFYLLGARAADKTIRSIFEEDVLGPLTFERRINLAVRVAQELLPQAEVKALQRRLNEMKSLRNAMAHSPCWFEPYLDHEAKVARLRPKIMRGKEELSLDGERGDQIGKDVSELVAETGRLVYLTLDPARTEADQAG